MVEKSVDQREILKKSPTSERCHFVIPRWIFDVLEGYERAWRDLLNPLKKSKIHSWSTKLSAWLFTLISKTKSQVLVWCRISGGKRHRLNFKVHSEILKRNLRHNRALLLPLWTRDWKSGIFASKSLYKWCLILGSRPLMSQSFRSTKYQKLGQKQVKISRKRAGVGVFCLVL